MNQVKKTIAAFIAAWDMLVDHPLPKISGPLGKKSKVSPGLVLLFFPVTGLVIGLLPLLAGGFAHLIFNRFAGAFVFAFLGAVIFWYKDSGRSISMLISYAAARISGLSAADALENADSSLGNVLKNPVILMFAVVGQVLVLAMLFALYWGGAGLWLPAVFAADTFVQGRLCLEPDRNSGRAFIRTAEPEGRSFLAGAGLVIALAALLVFPRIAALGAFVVIWVWFWRELPESADFKQGIAPDWISLWGFWAAVLMLVCGMGLL